tara:strand:- start:64 stop:567 length:504 start_codon:yes stop_codon:yes gene_type:complete
MYEGPNIQALLPGMIAESRTFVRKVAKENIARINDEINEWTMMKRKLETMVYRLWCEWNVEQLIEERKKFERYLIMATKNKDVKTSLFGVDAQQVARAKAVPIETLLSFNRSGFANCIWHNEKSPSMKYYKRDNSVHCFGCGKSGDAIDVAMVQWSCDFKEAVRRLT